MNKCGKRTFQQLEFTETESPLENAEFFPGRSRDSVLGAHFFGCAESHKEDDDGGGAHRQTYGKGQQAEGEQGARPPAPVGTGMTHP